MPRGLFGAPRLTELGPFVSSSNRLYHVAPTTSRDSIERYGIVWDKDIITSSVDEDEVSYSRGKVEGTNLIDGIVDYVGEENGEKEGRPDRVTSVFFFATKKNARQFADRNAFGADIHIVDPDKIPCNGYTAKIRDVFPIAKMVSNVVDVEYDTNGNISQVPDEAFNVLEGYWESVEPYNGQEESGLEVWFPCSAPPNSIVGQL